MSRMVFSMTFACAVARLADGASCLALRAPPRSQSTDLYSGSSIRFDGRGYCCFLCGRNLSSTAMVCPTTWIADHENLSPTWSNKADGHPSFLLAPTYQAGALSKAHQAGCPFRGVDRAGAWCMGEGEKGAEGMSYFYVFIMNNFQEWLVLRIHWHFKQSKVDFSMFSRVKSFCNGITK